MFTEHPPTLPAIVTPIPSLPFVAGHDQAGQVALYQVSSLEEASFSAWVSASVSATPSSFFFAMPVRMSISGAFTATTALMASAVVWRLAASASFVSPAAWAGSVAFKMAKPQRSEARHSGFLGAVTTGIVGAIVDGSCPAATPPAGTEDDVVDATSVLGLAHPATPSSTRPTLRPASALVYRPRRRTAGFGVGLEIEGPTGCMVFLRNDGHGTFREPNGRRP